MHRPAAMNRTQGSSLSPVLLLAVVLLAGVFFAWRVMGSGDEIDRPTAGMGAPSGSEEGAADDPAITVPSALEPGPATAGRTQAAPDEVKEAEPIPAEASDVLGLTGRLVMVGEDSVDPTELDGQITASLRGDSMGASFFVAVKDGRFRFDVRANSKGKLLGPDGEALPGGADDAGLNVALGSPEFYPIGNMTMAQADGSRAQGALPEWPLGTEDAVVYVTRGPGAKLHVVDKQTGAPLGGVKVVQAKSSFGHDLPLGIETVSLTRDESSPVYLSSRIPAALGGISKVYVCADGHAWAVITLDLQAESTRTVELERAGTLRVTVSGDVPEAGRLSLYRAGDNHVMASTAFKDEEPVVFDHLKADEYIARVELGEPYTGAKLLAEQTIVLGYGADKTVHLRAEAVVLAPKAVASGVLVVPPAWRLDWFRGTFSGLGASSDGSRQQAVFSQKDFTPILGRPGAYAFELPAMEVGVYELDLAPFSWKQIYELPPEGRSDLRFVLSDPVDLTVYVADDKTSEAAADVDSISWSPEWPKESSSGSSKSERVTDEPGVFQFQVTEGNVEISCSDGGYAYESVMIDTRVMDEVTLRLVRPSRATVVLKDGDQVVPWPSEDDFDVEPMPGTNGYNNSSGSGPNTPRWFGVSAPGHYKLIVPEINGFEVHAPVEFEMLRGEHIEIVVELTAR